jgi:NAD-dependent deacetylase
MLDPEAIRTAMRALNECDYMIVAGTSGMAQPAASMPLLACQAGAFVLEINTAVTDMSDQVSESIQAPSGEVLPRLVKAAFGNSANSRS